MAGIKKSKNLGAYRIRPLSSPKPLKGALSPQPLKGSSACLPSFRRDKREALSFVESPLSFDPKKRLSVSMVSEVSGIVFFKSLY